MESSNIRNLLRRRSKLILSVTLMLWIPVTFNDVLSTYLGRESVPHELGVLEVDPQAVFLQNLLILPLLLLAYHIAFYVYDRSLRSSINWSIQICIGLLYGVPVQPMLIVAGLILHPERDILPGGVFAMFTSTLDEWLMMLTGSGLMYFLGLFLMFNTVNRLDLAEEKLRLERLKSEWTALKLQVLRWQINPHFLFNSLNTVSSLLKSAPIRADSVLAKFSTLLRMTLREQESAYTTVGNELDYIHSYLDMEMVRFEDRLKLSIEADEDALDARVPCFLVQPLVENAIKHGIARIPGPSQISVNVAHMEGRLVFTVRNTSSRKYARETSETGGLGIKNLRERLAVLYPNSHMFDSGYVEDDDWKAVIEIPFELDPAANARSVSRVRDSLKQAAP